MSKKNLGILFVIYFRGKFTLLSEVSGIFQFYPKISKLAMYPPEVSKSSNLNLP
jgi:hypothetical protein